MEKKPVAPELHALSIRSAGVLALAALMAVPLSAQSNDDMRQVLERLDRLEKQNSELMDEVRHLRTELTAARNPAPAAAPESSDAIAVEQARIEEQAQAKVEAAHKLPLRITGMALFNAYSDSHADTGLESGTVPTVAGRGTAGGTLSQSIVGLEFQNPVSVFGANVHGAVSLDLWGNTPDGSGTGAYTWPMPRLRTGTVSFDWDSRSVTAGVDKPLIAPYEPDSFAQVAVPPLSGAGNLWLWEPQVRFEQRVRLPDAGTLRVQAALYSTHETYATVPAEYEASLAPRRPGWEARLEYAHRGGDEDLFRIGAGYHFSATHVIGQSVNSALVSVDGRFSPARWWSLTGTFFHGQNAAGLGGSGDGFTIEHNTVKPVHSSGGWLQLSLLPASRLSFHLYGGAQTNRASDLIYDAMNSNASYAGNIIYQISSNVFLSFEAWQTRTEWLTSGTRLRNQYDLGVAYLF